MPRGTVARWRYPFVAGHFAETIRYYYELPFPAECRTGIAEPDFTAAAPGVARAGRFAGGECPRQFPLAAAPGDYLAALAGANPKVRCDAQRDVAGGDQGAAAQKWFSDCAPVRFRYAATNFLPHTVAPHGGGGG